MARRIEGKIEAILSKDQFGFRMNMGIWDAILALRVTCNKIIRKNKSTFIAFVDLEKAFNNVNWTVIYKMLRRAGGRLRRQKVTVQIVRIRNSCYKN